MSHNSNLLSLSVIFQTSLAVRHRTHIYNHLTCKYTHCVLQETYFLAQKTCSSTVNMMWLDKDMVLCCSLFDAETWWDMANTDIIWLDIKSLSILQLNDIQAFKQMHTDVYECKCFNLCKQHFPGWHQHCFLLCIQIRLKCFVFMLNLYNST